jgi:uncharacterized protein
LNHFQTTFLLGKQEARVRQYRESCGQLEQFVSASQQLARELAAKSRGCKSTRCFEAYQDRISQISDDMENHGKRCSQVSGVTIDEDEE